MRAVGQAKLALKTNKPPVPDPGEQQERRLIPHDLDRKGVSLGSQRFIQPVIGCLNLAGSFHDVGLHLGGQVGKIG